MELSTHDPLPQKRDAVPLAAEQIASAAQARGLAIPPACEPGVAASLALLARHAATLRGEPVADRS